MVPTPYADSEIQAGAPGDVQMRGLTIKILDLAFASVVTLVIGGSGVFALEWVSPPLRPPLFFAAVLISISIGIGFLRYRRHEHLIPKAAVITVVMMAAFIYLDFLIAWYRGRVEL